MNRILYAKNREAIDQYCDRHKKLPNVAAPTSYPEMMLWRKLVDHNPLFVRLSDKLEAKKYVQSSCPDVLLPETLWIGDNADDIPEHILERDVIIKSKHGFNHNFEIRDGKVDRAILKKKTDQWLCETHGTQYFEWAYSKVKPGLFAEEIIGNAAEQLLEIDIIACNGRPLGGLVIGHNKLPGKWIAHMDQHGREVGKSSDKIEQNSELLSRGIDIDTPYQLALEYSRKLSVNIDLARFDFMWNGKQLYAGEITIYPGAGIDNIKHPEIHNTILYDWDLRESNYMRTAKSGIKKIYAGALSKQIIQRREMFGQRLTSSTK